MKGPFLALHARTLCHATENLEKVKQALTTAIGPAEIRVTRTEGHHGNPILVLEAVLEEQENIRKFFERLSDADLTTLIQSLSARIDDGCNLFIRLDKQSSFKGEIRMAQNDDVVSIRLRVLAFPAKCDIASAKAREFVEGVLNGRGASPEGP